MTSRRVFIAVEDHYAVPALRVFLRTRGVHASNVIVAHLPPRSPKMQRIVQAHLRQGSHVVIIVDAEDRPPTEVKQWIAEKHGVPNDDVIVVDPCMEALACEALGLKNCRAKPCRAGPLRSIDEYWRRVHRRRYEKRFLPTLFSEAAAQGALDEVPEVARLLAVVEQSQRDP